MDTEILFHAIKCIISVISVSFTLKIYKILKKYLGNYIDTNIEVEHTIPTLITKHPSLSNFFLCIENQDWKWQTRATIHKVVKYHLFITSI